MGGYSIWDLPSKLARNHRYKKRMRELPEKERQRIEAEEKAFEAKVEEFVEKIDIPKRLFKKFFGE